MKSHYSSVLLRIVFAAAIVFLQFVSAHAQTAIFFAAKDNATEFDIFRYRVTPTTAPVLETTITHNSLVYPLGLTLSPAGELFVVNQGTQGGFVSRFLSPIGTAVFNGTVPAGPEPTFYGAFRGNELFVVQRVSGVKRFIVNTNGSITANGQIPITPTIGELRGAVVTPWGELLISEASGLLEFPTIIHRFIFDANGNAQANGIITDSHIHGSHGMAFSPWGELFVTSPTTHSIARFTFDAAHNATFNGSITGGGLDYPLDLSFAPWGELFVGNQMSVPTPVPLGSYSGISRFTFDSAQVASSNGTVTTPLPISGITFVPPNSPLTVNSTDDTNDGVCDTSNCTLREAINAANSQPGDDTINFSVTGTIQLHTALPSLHDTVSFEGPGSDQLTIQRSTVAGTPDFGIFRVTTTGAVTFSGLKISNGGGMGTAANSVLGAGIHNINAGTLNIVRTNISGNSGNYGGGIYNYEGTVNISDSSIINNIANHPIDDTGGGNGGAIYNYVGAVTITNSLIANNSALTSGGGIFHYQGALKVTNTTIFGNSCNGAGCGIHHNDSGTADIANSTISGNSGGGVYNNGSGGGTTTLLNSIVALNSTDVQGSITSLGYNVIGNGGIVAQVGDHLGVTAPQLKLGALANNGGPTKTMALGFGSLAIDAGNDCVIETPGCLMSPLTTDQRGLGFARKFGAHVDVGAVEGASDTVAPVTTTEVSTEPNASGWHNANVTVSLSVVDENDGSGVKEIVYSTVGAQTIGATTVSGSSASVDIVSEGITTIYFYSRDNANNSEPAQTLIIKLDKSAPLVSCATADSLWHANDVIFPCTASDVLSGLVSSADASFSLSTNAALGIETANATTNTKSVCDLAGNCTTAGPISGVKVDRKAPTVEITCPTVTNYLLNQSVMVNFNCSDGGSGVGSCVGTTASGNALDTGSIGAKGFTVNATDNVGNSAAPSIVNYTVGFGVQALFDQSKAHKSGSTVPIKVRLVDASGANVSSGVITVHAITVVQTGSQASSILEDAGNANPDYDFRYDASLGGYVFNLKTTGFGTGSYMLTFTVSGSPTLYSIGFQVRQ